MKISSNLYIVHSIHAHTSFLPTKTFSGALYFPFICIFYLSSVVSHRNVPVFRHYILWFLVRSPPTNCSVLH